MGVQQTQAAQTRLGFAVAGEFGDEDAVLPTGNDHDRHALAVDEHADLAAHAAAQQGQLFGLIGGEPAQTREGPVVQAGQGRNLAGFEACEAAEGFGGDGSPPSGAVQVCGDHVVVAGGQLEGQTGHAFAERQGQGAAVFAHFPHAFGVMS